MHVHVTVSEKTQMGPFSFFFMPTIFWLAKYIMVYINVLTKRILNLVFPRRHFVVVVPGDIW